MSSKDVTPYRNAFLYILQVPDLSGAAKLLYSCPVEDLYHKQAGNDACNPMHLRYNRDV